VKNSTNRLDQITILTLPEKESRASGPHGLRSCWQPKWRKAKKRFEPGFVTIEIFGFSRLGVIDIERTNVCFAPEAVVPVAFDPCRSRSTRARYGLAIILRQFLKGTQLSCI
jgi:hypothetical protein